MRSTTAFLPFIMSLSLLAGMAQASPPHHSANGLRADGPSSHRLYGPRAERSPKPYIIPAEPLSLDEAVRKVRRRTGGRILDARTVERNGRIFHRIKVLTDGKRVRVIRIDADDEG